MFNFFKKKKINFTSGANIDTRSEEEKKKDYKIEELVTSFTPVNWVEKSESEIKRFPIFNQNGSGSCVAQTMAKMMGIMYWLKNDNYVHFSATDIYQRRNNKPSSGMSGINVFDIARDGVTLEQLVPSQSMTDQQMDSVNIEEYKREVGEIFKIGNYIILPTTDIETIASTIQTTGKPVMTWFFFQNNEWTDVPEVINTGLKVDFPSTGRHSVTAVDFTLYKGKKAIVIEDSWGPNYGNAGQRIITEDFFNTRNFFSAYAMNFSFDEEINKPKHRFNQDMEFGDSNEEVKVLQDVLKYEKLFPLNVDSTGYFGAVTKKAVEDFQLKHGVADSTNAGFGRVGPLTRAKLNELYE